MAGSNLDFSPRKFFSSSNKQIFIGILGKVLLFFHENVCCVHMLESPRQDDFNEYT